MVTTAIRSTTPNISARGLTRRAIRERMTPRERTVHAQLVADRGFDVTRLVVDGFCPARLGDEELMVHMVESQHWSLPLGAEAFDVDVNLLDCARRIHLGVFQFNVRSLSDRVTIESHGAGRTSSPVLHGHSVRYFFDRYGDVEDRKGGYKALRSGAYVLVSGNVRGLGFGGFLYGLGAYVAGRIYTAESHKFYANYRSDAEGFYRHILEKAGVASETFDVPPMCFNGPQTRFHVPLHELDGLLGLLLG